MQDFNSELSATRFFACILAILSASLLAVLAAVFLIDPYKIWQQEAVSDFNEIKLDIPFSAQMNSAILKSALHAPDVLILGSSRVRRGFNLTDATRLLGGKVLITGIDRLPISVAKDLFYAISKNTHLKKLYLEVDYFTSNACVNVNIYPSINEKSGPALAHLNPMVAVMQSVKTLKINLLGPRTSDAYFDQQGTYHDAENISFSPSATHQLSVRRHFDTTAANCQRQPATLADARDLADIFSLAQVNNTEVILLTLPASASWRARVRQAGLDPVIAQFKENISEQARQFHGQYLDYDDSHIASVRQSGNKLQMPPFWDEVHFSNRLGDHILNDMAHASPVAKVPFTRHDSLAPQP